MADGQFDLWGSNSLLNTCGTNGKLALEQADPVSTLAIRKNMQPKKKKIGLDWIGLGLDWLGLVCLSSLTEIKVIRLMRIG